MTSTSLRPQRLRVALPLLAMAILVVLAGASLPSAAQVQPISTEILSPRSEFSDDVSLQIRNKLDGSGTHVLNLKDPSRTTVARITVQPGAQFPWHTHPGAVLANVAQGELVYVNASDCVERPYPAGTVFVDPGHGNVHTAFNRTDEATVVIATFVGVPETGPLTEPVAPGDQPYSGCQVDT